MAEDKTVTRETTTSYEDASNYLCGTALPDVYGGFGTSFSYKGVDVSIDFAYQIGGQCYDYDYASMMSSPTSNVWLWSKRPGLDPRQSITGQVTASYYAPIRTISGGVTFTF